MRSQATTATPLCPLWASRVAVSCHVPLVHTWTLRTRTTATVLPRPRRPRKAAQGAVPLGVALPRRKCPPIAGKPSQTMRTRSVDKRRKCPPVGLHGAHSGVALSQVWRFRLGPPPGSVRAPRYAPSTRGRYARPGVATILSTLPAADGSTGALSDPIDGVGMVRVEYARPGGRFLDRTALGLVVSGHCARW